MPDGRKDPVDQHVGAAIRARRQALGITQKELAKALGLTFQQVQKYERGENRISASKIFRAAVTVHCHPGDFFMGLLRLGNLQDADLLASAGEFAGAVLALPEIRLLSGMPHHQLRLIGALIAELHRSQGERPDNRPALTGE